MRLVSCSFSEVGEVRKINQDAIYVSINADSGIFLVADGMGGHAEGERASRTIQKAVEDWWNVYLNRGRDISIQIAADELRAQMMRANKEIREATERSQICGSTVVLLWIQGSQYVLLWAGDSRCYQVERHFPTVRCSQLTTDDVWEHYPGIISCLSEEEIRNHPNKGKLTRAVGVTDIFQCSVSTGVVSKNMLFVLCSDGVYKYIDPSEFETSLKACLRTKALEKQLEHLKLSVYENGATDNLSCVMVKVE